MPRAVPIHGIVQRKIRSKVMIDFRDGYDDGKKIRMTIPSQKPIKFTSTGKDHNLFIKGCKKIRVVSVGVVAKHRSTRCAKVKHHGKRRLTKSKCSKSQSIKRKSRKTKSRRGSRKSHCKGKRGDSSKHAVKHTRSKRSATKNKRKSHETKSRRGSRKSHCKGKRGDSSKPAVKRARSKRSATKNKRKSHETKSRRGSRKSHCKGKRGDSSKPAVKRARSKRSATKSKKRLVVRRSCKRSVTTKAKKRCHSSLRSTSKGRLAASRLTFRRDCSEPQRKRGRPSTQQ